MSKKKGFKMSKKSVAEEAKREERKIKRILARKEARKPKFIKQDFQVVQKKLTASWAFPVARLEEFLGLFQQAAYNVAVERMSFVSPVENREGENHSIEARRLVSAIQLAAYAVKDGFRTMPHYCEVDYFFWIISGLVYFGCVLPSSEKIANPVDSTGRNIEWVKNPPYLIGREIYFGQCPDGVIPTYVKMLNFVSGKMVGVQEFARRMVPNPKERAWAIQYALCSLAAEIQCNRSIQAVANMKSREMRMGGSGMIAKERIRQINEEGFTAARDDSYDKGELRQAARAYSRLGLTSKSSVPAQWPSTWDKTWWKPTNDDVVNLVKAGALIAAEIDRVLRMRAREDSRPSPAKVMQKVIRQNFPRV